MAATSRSQNQNETSSATPGGQAEAADNPLEATRSEARTPSLLMTFAAMMGSMMIWPLFGFSHASSWWPVLTGVTYLFAMAIIHRTTRFVVQVRLPYMAFGVMLIASHVPQAFVEMAVEPGKFTTNVQLTSLCNPPLQGFRDVVGNVRFINSQGQYKDFPVTWADWQSGETKSISLATPFVDVVRIEFHTLSADAKGYLFDCALKTHSPLSDSERKLQQLNRRLMK